MNVEDYWLRPPPERSAKCVLWVKKIEAGWFPNRRISQMGYYSAAEFYGVYIWEYLNVISPMLNPPPITSSTVPITCHNMANFESSRPAG